MDSLVADVVIVGFGAAGACAAIEAADAGAKVLVLDRFSGGGASAVSGGVVYAGGGTAQQRDAGVDDSVDAMYDYLRLEVGDVVSEETLRRFCVGSTEMITWLEGNGVPFEGSLCPYKTSYPSDAHYLYYSGSEAAGGFRDAAKPAPRGHRVKGPGTSGKLLMARLAGAVRRRGIQVLPQTAARNLVVDADGTVTGVVVSTLRDAPARARAAHRRLAAYAAKPGIYVPSMRKSLHRRVERIERQYGRELRISASRGVVLAAGGFIANRELVREHAPAYRGGLALGTSADDGSGIRLGVEAGAATAELGRISAWRFITPPSAFLGGLLVDKMGGRIIDESRYGAAVGERMITGHEGRGWLLVDDAIVREVRRDARGQSQWFQGLQVRYLLRQRVVADSLEGVARKAGIDPDGLAASVEAARSGADPTGKPAEFARPLDRPPYSLIDVSIRPTIGYPCPMLTLGGLVVDEETGAVRAGSGVPIRGLYAAGRTAVGICSRSYVSGLSLADCVFSGRRAGAHSALDRGSVDKNENVF
ncbi:FAD-binding protein [Amycolatopsis regifaucium]|uniref:23S rRNA methyltransferase n=1 Tax=Amycolatopsis regifaucium TaxID=546365 RepID=A0A154MK97_9PSEU|nr:FAD-binding protein [Amycolatopsis regifaucium]KZB84453.1 23S rRNA methyltransferase [Amycolatopsis regifaucium]OKA10916.1 23S rRNA methyltransferase [Amycolatopsis regifaucium]SFI21944.1 3-oxo-5alpha-steroid 4-dehydrogenase [Amycolatopsis regifaucium]